MAPPLRWRTCSTLRRLLHHERTADSGLGPCAFGRRRRAALLAGHHASGRRRNALDCPGRLFPLFQTRATHGLRHRRGAFHRLCAVQRHPQAAGGPSAALRSAPGRSALRLPVRPVLFVHWPTDVAAGILIGTLGAAVGATLIRRWTAPALGRLPRPH